MLTLLLCIKYCGLQKPCKYLLKKISKLSKINFENSRFKKISDLPDGLDYLPYYFLSNMCVTCTTFPRELLLFKKKIYCLKCFYNLKKDEGVLYIISAKKTEQLGIYHFFNNANQNMCEKCNHNDYKLHECDKCCYKICSQCFDDKFYFNLKKSGARCNHTPSQFNFKV